MSIAIQNWSGRLACWAGWGLVLRGSAPLSPNITPQTAPVWPKTASPIVNRNLCPRFSGIGKGRGDGRLSRIRPGVRCKAMEAYR